MSDGSVDTSEFRWEAGATEESVTSDLDMLAALGGAPVSVPEESSSQPPAALPDVAWP